MRSSKLFHAAAFIVSAVALVVACGSEESSTFNPTVEQPDSGPIPPNPGFNNGDSGTVDAGGSTNCKPLTCAEQGIECGPAGDGCGGLIQDCGKCGTGLRCGGPGAPSKCVSPNIGTACTPKTCQQLGVGCGPAGDGCGAIIANCGTCQAGQQCGNATTASQCVAATPTGPDGGACVARTCAFYTALGMDCGKQSDGCGLELDCGTCSVSGEFCGGAGPSKCGNPTVCIKKDCTNYPTGTCGQQSDDCGGLTANCLACTLPEICGGGGTPSKCGGGSVVGPDGGACVPRTIGSCGATECGQVADGCGGVLDCGVTNCNATDTICGGGGTPNVCGTPTCTKVPATQALACANKNCGVVSDGCGGTWVCGGPTACTSPAICGGGGTPNVCGGGTVTGPDGGTCTPNTTCPAGTCGPIADGCGGILTCPNCTVGECGGGGVPSQCGGGNSCTPISKTIACGSQTCGYAPDGCGSGSVNGGYYACGTLNGACPTGQQCGLFAPNQCGSLSGPCITTGSGTTCTSNTQCCSGFCGATGQCIASQCADIGTTCISNSQCCSGKCTGNQCVTNNTGACKPAGNTCGSNAECCSKGCLAGSDGISRCSLATSYCRQTNEVCTSSTQCCGGSCVGATSTVPGKCGIVSAPGGGTACTIAGTVVSCSSSTTYVCNADCCSGACGPNDSAPGFQICQQPSGCAAQGELCVLPTDCCGNPANGSLTCSKPAGASATDYGRCNSANGCSKPGEICKTATDACSFPNNCCEPADIAQGGGGNCNSNPAACCRHDGLGIPRCTRFAVCRTLGQDCETSADCCNAVPCTDHDNDASTPNRCGATCIADNEFCSVDEDCCGGNCYKQTAGAQVGQCKIPTCTPKTCANFPAGTCGQQSDGCGGLTVDCQPCTYPQTCGGGGTPNQCGGTVCTPITVCPSGFECGTIPNGCGGTVACGTCTLPETCGGGGTAYQCGQPACTALTCEQQNIQCGQTGNGCGQVITCPDCPDGTTCGGGGVANQCGTPACTPKTCPAGLNCGQYPNGCGGGADCGICPQGQTCGGGGTPNVCGNATCTSKTCAQQFPTGIKNCGTISDLCGGVSSCGTCPLGQSCVDNECIGSACVPKTCTQLGVQCGQVADGCGGLTPDCGPCPVGQGCGAGGTPNVCGSQPCTGKTCQDLGAVCGQVANGCGGLTPNCGDCGGNLACSNGQCVQACTPRSCTDAGANCGFVSDGCGGVVDCGVCPDGFECGYAGVANVCGRFNPN